MTNVFFTSDTHFGHSNIIKYCNRPFATAEEMDEEIIKRWNNVVSKDSTVFHLGDFSLHHNKRRLKEIVDKLNGKIHLILGNHDRMNLATCLEVGFTFVSKWPIIVEEYFILSHRPIFLNSNCQPYINIHGHVHDGLPKFISPWYMNVSTDVCDFRPVALEEIKKHFNVGIEQGKLEA